MMHQCYCSQGGSVAGQCSACGAYRSQSSAFSNMFFDPSSSFDHQYQYQYASSSSVDCTLSLGTPSTRMSSDHHRRPSYSSCGWEHNNSASAPRRGPSNTSSNDPLLARRCANCDTTSTPLWRNGPRGPKSLCNACGIRFKKEERRASAAASSGGGATEQEQHVFNNSSSWGHQAQKMPCYTAAGTEYRFMDDVDNRDSFLSWRLNVTDRPAGLVHDFTR